MLRRLLSLLCLLAISLNGQAAMPGMYGPYAMSREASGTSWQPESTPHAGIHVMSGDWMWMTHGYVDLVYDKQGGARGGEKNFAAGMLMAMGRRTLGPGALGVRGMISLDPAMGPFGYPLLLQTGETADGVNHLVDRQHPHDFIMELAVSYNVALGADSAAFAYFGLPGEPALGPPAFMHRLSGEDNPEAPISHHWLDSTHIAEGVSTVGVSHSDFKIEGSAFGGREPDRYRWDIEPGKLNSFSGRLSWNPSADWALQTSYGRIVSPEALEPTIDQRRLTASASVNTHYGDGLQQTTFAFGRAANTRGQRVRSAFLLESAARFARSHTVFGRAERVDKNELFKEGEPGEGETFIVGKLSLGYRYDFPRMRRGQVGVGGLASVYALPANIRPSFGHSPVSFMLFLRAKLV